MIDMCHLFLLWTLSVKSQIFEISDLWLARLF
jgi:hypothetical protein